MVKQPDMFADDAETDRLNGSSLHEAETTPTDPEARRIALAVLAGVVKECQRCPELASSRTQTVFGVGPVGAEILFVGEAPGGDEDRQGVPFVGVAGQLLNKIIAACGLRREEVFICNILRCRPPGNRVPKPDECANCREYLEKTIDLVAPKIICCWGGVAAQNLLKTKTGITKLRGQFYEFKGIPVICTFHPASLLEGRSPQNKGLVWEDMKTMLAKIGKPIPTPKKKD
ncbi:uracil-DNA glycosylase [Zavarzinella formosa]|uniref:uracil-DNA glycosylase n=1 Tax=Zavarzinella formosa TaxID=360055 RepID=UPI000A03BDBB|nr:uracil-DNA glycosylase [Zavarzinella formosa]